MANFFENLVTKSWEEALHKQAAKLGADEGKKGNPALDTPPYDVGETFVRNKVQEKVVAAKKKVGTQIQNIHPSLVQKHGDLTQAELNFEARRAPEECENFYEACLAENKTKQVETLVEKYVAERDYQHFRQVNNVTIDPDHPEDRLHYLSIIAVFLVIEAAANAIFWTDAFAGYAVMGIFVAIVVAAINIALGVVAGVALAYKNLGDPSAQKRGVAGFIVLMILVVALNCGIISIRSSITSSVNGATGESDTALISIILMFALGIAFALIGAYKGYRLFGSIPGYEKASSRYLAAKAKLENLNTRIKKEIRDDADSQVTLRTSIVKKVNDVQVYLARAASDINQLAGEYSLALKMLSKVLEDVVNVYRQSNRAVKGAKTPSPAWFDDPVEKYESEHPAIDEVRERHSASTALADDLHARIKDVASDEIARVQEQKGRYLGDRLKEFMQECETEATLVYHAQLGAVGGQGR